MREPTSPVGRILEARTRRRADVVLLALLTALASLALVLPGLSAPARADVNAGIKVTDLTLTKSDRSGADLEGPLKVKDIAKLSFTWDATGANPKSGDSFNIGLGEYFNNLVQPQSASMAVTYNGEPTEVGTCTLDKTMVTCTFNDKLDELKAAGFTNFKGTTSALLLVMGRTADETTNMTVNGNAVQVDLPGTGGIQPHDPVAWQMNKIGSVIGEDSKNIYWEVDFGADYISQQMKDTSTPVATDGNTRSTITFTDTLGSGSRFSQDPSQWELQYWGQNNEPYPDDGVTLTNAAGKDSTVEHGDFDLSVEFKDDVATITVTGPFRAGANYRLFYRSEFTSDTGRAVKGIDYENTVSLPNGTSASDTQAYTVTFTVDVEMAAGFGGFNVLKKAGGDAADKIPAGTTFEIGVNYVLPNAAGTYAGWEAPGTLNADNKTGFTTMEVELGDAITYPGTFPAGTVVTLTEDTATASPSADGYTWGDPVFTVGETETSTFTIEDQKATSVTVTNTAALTPAPSPAPSQSPALSQSPDPSQSPAPSQGPAPSSGPSSDSNPAAPSPTASSPNPAASISDPKPGNSLASTGAAVLVPLLVAGGALGGGAMMVRRRRKARV